MCFIMPTYTEKLLFETKNQIEFLNITTQVQNVISKSKIKEGMVLVNAMHITASVYINDAENGLINDYQKWLKRLAPMDVKLYEHNLTGEDNIETYQVSETRQVLFFSNN